MPHDGCQCRGYHMIVFGGNNDVAVSASDTVLQGLCFGGKFFQKEGGRNEFPRANFGQSSTRAKNLHRVHNRNIVLDNVRSQCLASIGQGLGDPLQHSVAKTTGSSLYV